MDWIRKRLQVDRPKNVSLAFMAQHQPLKCPWYIPNAGFCFSSWDQDTLRATLKSSKIPESSFWGAFVGHIHEWGWYSSIFEKDGKGFENFHQLQVSGCKGNQFTTEINGAISIVSFDEKGVDIPNIQRFWHENNSSTWFFAQGPPALSIEREVKLHQLLAEREFSE